MVDNERGLSKLYNSAVLVRLYHIYIFLAVLLLLFYYLFSSCTNATETLVHTISLSPRPLTTSSLPASSAVDPSTLFSEYPTDLIRPYSLGLVYDNLHKFQHLIDEAAGGRKFIIGNMAWHPVQLYYYYRLVMAPHVRNVCEVGYGAGHSSVMVLSANPTVNLYSFDLFPTAGDEGEFPSEQIKYHRASLDFVSQTFGSRFHKIRGNSNETIPAFPRQHPHFKCDVISVDGSHTPPQPFYDIVNFVPLAHAHTVLILDDMDALKSELLRAEKQGYVKILECLRGENWVDQHFTAETYYQGPQEGKQFCSAKYRI